MDSLTIKGSKENPSIICDPTNGLIEIKGNSIGEDPLMQIYRPVLEWLDHYKENYQAKTIVNIQLNYFNTSSTRSLLHVFKRLRNMQLENNKAEVEINWHYNDDDEDMHEIGQFFKESVKLTFNFVAN